MRMRCKVVENRVDALTLAYRVELASHVLLMLRARHEVAKLHGRAAVDVGGLSGEMKFSRIGSRWAIAAEDLRVMIDSKAPGAPEGTDEPGWTVELVWSAQALAALGDVDRAVVEARRIVDSLGPVLEERVRRVDLCADVAGWQVDAEQADRLVRRPRAKVTQHGADGERAAATLHQRRAITGISVCPGGALMARIYDKHAEMEMWPSSKEHDVKREIERERWRNGGWDGTAPITRVEFQIRGEAIRDLGGRDPRKVVDLDRKGNVVRESTLGRAIDGWWRRCTWWLRLVKLTDERLARCKLDPRWEAVRRVTFVGASPMWGRKRFRGGASAEQTLGCALSVIGGELAAESPRREVESTDAPVFVDEMVREEVREVFVRAAAAVAERLVSKWGPSGALAHLAIVANATRKRFLPAALAKGRGPAVAWCVDSSSWPVVAA